MADQKFTWLLDDCYDGYLNKLEKGKIYDARIVPPHVLEEWVRTGAAQIVQAGKKKAGEEE
jgi:hypothetical protein